MQAMVLAAGLGTRLWPLTIDRGKPAVPFLGKPLIQGIIELLDHHGFERAVVNTHHRPESIRGAVRAPQGLDVRFSHEPEILGTAGCIAQALRSGALLDAPTLIINAKLHTDIDLAAAMNAHENSGAKVTMVLKPNPQRGHFREVFSTPAEDGNRWVSGFGEGRIPKGPDPQLFTGVHILSSDVCASIPLRCCDTIRDIYPPLIEAGRVLAHTDDARWWEFSTLARYLALHQEATTLGLGPQVHRSPGAQIDASAEVVGSVLWENSSVGAQPKVQDCIVGAGVSIPSGARLQGQAVVRAELVSPEDFARGQRVGDLFQVPVMP